MLALLLLSPQAAALTNVVNQTIMTNWFLSLTTGQALGVVFFGGILIGCLVIWAIETAGYLFRYARREYRLGKFPDEHEFREDPYALLSYAVDTMKDDVHVEHAKYILGKRAAISVLHPSNYTCFHCAQQQDCPFAFDAYNMDGDCLATK
jgi:hypothetical protein